MAKGSTKQLKKKGGKGLKGFGSKDLMQGKKK